MRPFLLGGILSDVALMEDFIQDVDPTDLNYTIVRPPRLTYGKLLLQILRKIDLQIHEMAYIQTVLFQYLRSAHACICSKIYGQ